MATLYYFLNTISDILVYLFFVHQSLLKAIKTVVTKGILNVEGKVIFPIQTYLRCFL